MKNAEARICLALERIGTAFARYNLFPPRKGPGMLTSRHKRADRALARVGKDKPGAWKRHNWLKHRLLNSPGISESGKTERLGRRVPHYRRHDLAAALGRLAAVFGSGGITRTVASREARKLRATTSDWVKHNRNRTARRRIDVLLGRAALQTTALRRRQSTRYR